MAQLFAARPAGTGPNSRPPSRTGSGAGGGAGARKTDTEVRLLEFKRANNVAIGLAQFRQLASHEQVLEAALTFDAARVPVSKLATLQELLPTPEEVAAVRAYDGDPARLAQPERFFLVAGSVPRGGAKLGAVLLAHQFAEQGGELGRSVRALASCCREVRASERLASFLDSILAIGNVMNAGTYKGGAAGFTLDSLLKLTHLRSVDARMTLLEFAIEMLEKKGSTDPLRFPEDLPHLREACRLAAPDLVRDARQLRVRWGWWVVGGGGGWLRCWACG